MRDATSTWDNRNRFLKKNHDWPRFALQLGQILLHLLSPADQHGGEEAQSHPQLVHEGLVICDVSEQRKTRNVFPVAMHNTSYRLLECECIWWKRSYLYQGYTKFSRTSSRICQEGEEAIQSKDAISNFVVSVIDALPPTARRPPWREFLGQATADSFPAIKLVCIDGEKKKWRRHITKKSDMRFSDH